MKPTNMSTFALACCLFAPEGEFGNNGGGGTTAEDQTFDPLGLSLDLNEVDTSMPVLVPGAYILKIDSVALVENNDKTGNNLLVIFHTTSDATSTEAQAKGKENDIKAGFPLRQYYPMQGSAKNPDWDYKKNLATLQDAVTGSKMGNRGPFLPTTYVNRTVMANIKVANDPDRGPQNNIARLSMVPL